jgi:N utilization substance protein A
MAINAQEFRAALEAIEVSKGISKEVILNALHEAMTKGFKKQLGGDDALVEVTIDLDNGVIDMCHIKKIVDEVEDDFLEISKEDAEEEAKNNKGVIVNDEFRIPASVEDLRKATAMSIKSILKQKFAEVEKGILYEAFKGKINTIITGTVEKFDERGCSVSIGKTSVFLPRRAMIGDEVFKVGEPIKLYVEDVASGSRGAHIVVSRSSTGFLKTLFNEEIHDIYDGTITIKAIARRAGERSKVAVYSQDPNVDPAGACIGQNGSKIQKIVSQLGNGQTKEKIDIIAWSENVALFIMEALKPANVVGIALSEEGKKATVIVDNDSFTVAIGRKGVNIGLATKLTGYAIQILTEDDANEQGIEYKTFEDIQAEEIALKAQRIRDAQLKSIQDDEASALPGLPEDYVAPLDRVYEEETDEDREEALILESEKEVTISEPVVEETPVVEEVKEETVVEEVKEETVVTTVSTTTTIEDLEKSLEEDKSKSKHKGGFKRNKKKKDEQEEEETKPTTSHDPSSYMSIYTEEELREMELEEEEDEYYDDEDIDYDEYDEYYDDDNN